MRCPGRVVRYPDIAPLEQGTENSFVGIESAAALVTSCCFCSVPESRMRQANGTTRRAHGPRIFQSAFNPGQRVAAMLALVSMLWYSARPAMAGTPVTLSGGGFGFEGTPATGAGTSAGFYQAWYANALF